MNKLSMRLIKVAYALLKTAEGDIHDVNRKLKRVSDAINSGKLSPKGLQQASQMVIQLTQQIINMQAQS